MSYMVLSRRELLDKLDILSAFLFPLSLRKDLKGFLKDNQGNIEQLREQYLDVTEGTIIRISRGVLLNDYRKHLDPLENIVQALILERFEYLIITVKNHPDVEQMVPADIARYLREGLSNIWHMSQSNE